MSRGNSIQIFNKVEKTGLGQIDQPASIQLDRLFHRLPSLCYELYTSSSSWLRITSAPLPPCSSAQMGAGPVE